MGMFGDDIFDVVNAMTDRLKKEKMEKDAFRRWLNYGDLGAKAYLEATGHKPLPPSVPQIRENERQMLLEVERLRQKQKSTTRRDTNRHTTATHYHSINARDYHHNHDTTPTYSSFVIVRITASAANTAVDYCWCVNDR